MTKPDSPFILTTTAQQARFLRDYWPTQNLSRETSAWERPQILSFSAWLHQCWTTWLESNVDLPLLLRPEQERYLWQETFPVTANNPFLRISALVEQAMKAYRTLHEWDIDPHNPTFDLIPHTEEIALFIEWKRKFEARCKSEQLLPAAQLTKQIQQTILSDEIRRIVLPEAIQTYRIEDWPPTAQQLIAALEQQDIVCSSFKLPKQTENSCFIELENEQNELLTVAHWSKNHLQKGSQRIGIIFPNLSEKRTTIAQVFSETLVPKSAVHPIPSSQRPFALSGNASLLADPYIYIALQWLQFLHNGLSLAETGVLLRSPFLLDKEELDARTQIDLRLRTAGNPHILLPTLLFHAENLDQKLNRCPQLSATLQTLHTQLKTRTTATEWAKRFTHWLTIVSWNKNATENEQAFFIYDQWREALNRFSALGDFIGDISFGRALTELLQTLQQLPATAPNTTAPIQILSREEARGLQFDALWIAGCHTQHWPKTEPLNPFLPREWQMAHLPFTDPQKALVTAQKEISAFQHAASEVIFSAPAQIDGQETIASSLFADLPRKKPSDWHPSPQQPWWQIPIQSETVTEPQTPLPHSQMQGGSSVLTDQSQCPFRAFIRHRLQAKKLETEHIGLDARERGILLHKILEQCWDHPDLQRDQKNLKNLSDDSIRALAEFAVAAVVQTFQQSRTDRIGNRFAQNEQERLIELTFHALKLDQQRAVPFTIEAMEEKQLAELSSLAITLKMDRIDQVEINGEKKRVLIDYKTGSVSATKWQGERPEELQLPLYATQLEAVTAVLYEEIRSDSLAYKGETEFEEILDGIPKNIAKIKPNENWEQQLSDWQTAIQKLAAEFKAGEAQIAPLKGKQNCQYCGLEMICQVEFS